MAEIEIEGADKQALEHQAEKGDNLTIRIALLTVMLAIVAVVFNHFGEEMNDDAQEVRLEAAQTRTMAGNQWAYFQAKSTKQSLAENVSVLSPDDAVKAKFREKAARYDKEKADIQAEAKRLDARADTLNGRSEAIKKPESRMKLALPLLQVAIALASITALTRVKWMLWIAILFAAAGIGVAGSALIMLHRLEHAAEQQDAAHEAHEPPAAAKAGPTPDARATK